MKLANKEFKNYLKNLRISFDNGNTYLTDDLGEVCQVNVQDSTHEIGDVITIDRVEYRLTEKQKDELFAMTHDEGTQYLVRASEYWDVRDDQQY
jgi:hypothetical protein